MQREVVYLKTFTAWALGGSNSFSPTKMPRVKQREKLEIAFISQQITLATNSGFTSHSVHFVLRENCLTQASEKLFAAMVKQKLFPHPHLSIIWFGKFKIISQFCFCDFNTVSEPLRDPTTTFSSENPLHVLNLDLPLSACSLAPSPTSSHPC